MSTRLAIIDIDGVVADTTARFAKAEEAKQAYLDEMRELQITDPRGATDTFWRTAFDPALVPLDTLIEGTNDALNVLLQDGYKVIYLTSRPHAMAEATLDWFSLSVFIEQACDIIFKMPAFQYIKTVTWKVGMIQTLAALYEAEKVLVIDDEEANINELRKHVPFPRGEQVNWCESLAQAVEAL